MKTDSEIKQNVQAELAWDPAVKSTAIGVAVKNGVVSITGHLDNYAEKWAVEKALRRVSGVKAIALELDVKLAPDHQRNDTDIANAAEQAITWHALVPENAVRLLVNKGWITAEGEVDWEYQRKSVETALRNIKGVVGVSNQIKIKAKAVQADLQRSIKDALTRQAMREADQIDIQIKDGTVTLKGNVHSWHERDAVQGAAWSAPGVRLVVNELKIA